MMTGRCFALNAIDWIGENEVMEKHEFVASTADGCICHKGSKCLRVDCGIYHHKDCPVHANYHATPSVVGEGADDAPERIWMNKDDAKMYDHPETLGCVNFDVPYIKASAVEGLVAADSVDAALKELREMFPAGYISIRVSGSGFEYEVPRSATIGVNNDEWNKPSLAEAMAAVRRYYDDGKQADIDVFQAGDY